MLDPQKTLEREALLRRYHEIQAELAQIDRNLREGEARLPVEEQLRLYLWRLMESNTKKFGTRGGVARIGRLETTTFLQRKFLGRRYNPLRASSSRRLVSQPAGHTCLYCGGSTYRPPYNLDCWKTRNMDDVSLMLLIRLRRIKLRIGLVISRPPGHNERQRHAKSLYQCYEQSGVYIGNHIESASGWLPLPL